MTFDDDEDRAQTLARALRDAERGAHVAVCPTIGSSARGLADVVELLVDGLELDGTGITITRTPEAQRITYPSGGSVRFFGSTMALLLGGHDRIVRVRT